MKKSFTLICILFYSLNALAVDYFKCVISGTVVDRNSKVILLKKKSDDELSISVKIPVTNNKFSYTLIGVYTEAYELIFEEELASGSWTPIVFFPYNGKVNFKLHSSDDNTKNSVSGGTLNEAYTRYNREWNKLFGKKLDDLVQKQVELQAAKKYYSTAWDSIILILTTTPHEDIDRQVYLKREKLQSDGAQFTEAGRAVHQQINLLYNDIDSWRYRYINNNLSLLSYYLLLSDEEKLDKDSSALSSFKSAVEKFEKSYPKHPYTKLANYILTGLNTVKVGQVIPDAVLPDLKGKSFSIKKISAGKYTLVDFWGSWCGPCIAASRTFVPVYNKFKDEGFTIIGIAKEYKDTKGLLNTLKKEKFPWQNLVELNDKHNIWRKFGINNSTGLMILLDKDSRIIAIDPTADDVAKLLSSSL